MYFQIKGEKMKIQSMQNQTFEAKSRFLPQKTHSQVKELLNKMNAETVCNKTEMTFSSNILSALKINSENAFFHDGRCLIDTAKDKFIHTSSLEFGKTELTFDNSTGEIVGYKKPFFKKWTNIIRETGKIIQQACENFDNSNIVEKRFVGIIGFTSKGAKNLEEAQAKIKDSDEVFLESLNGVF